MNDVQSDTPKESLSMSADPSQAPVNEQEVPDGSASMNDFAMTPQQKRFSNSKGQLAVYDSLSVH